jgi:TRAP-type C4-dicarboxylate transport system permease small subunit
MSKSVLEPELLDSQEAREEGLSIIKLNHNALGGSLISVRIPELLRDVAAFFFLPIIVVVISVDVVGRYFFSHPFQWSQEVATLALFLLFIAAIPFTTAADGHVRTETMYENYSERQRHIADAIASLCGAIFMGVIAIWQIRELPGLYKRGEGAEFINIPYWPISLFVALCMLFGMLQLLLRLIERIRDAMQNGAAI